MELYDGRRRPTGTRVQALKIYAMSSIADDYEDFEQVAKTLEKWAEEDGLQFGLDEILHALAELIGDGHAQAYVLSEHPPHVLVADYSEGRAHDLWFMLTAAGKQALDDLDADPSDGSSG
jgi:hypothetical protein